VPLRTSATLADRLGGWPEALIAWATVAAIAWAIGISVRNRRRPDRQEPGTAAE
jgi:apolipoprotein N-acyltransferase